MKKQTKSKSNLALFCERRPVRALIGATALLLAYVFASWAIDSGSLLDYAITLLLIIVGFKELLASLRSKGKVSER
jgi:hypothetical protein